MYRDRISEDIYTFTSSIYVQVTAGAILTAEGAIVIDTLPFPSETRQVAEFVARSCPPGVRYVIITHHHADHTYGTCQFPGAQIIGHALCRQLLAERGPASLAIAKKQSPELSGVELVLPTVVFDNGEMTLRLGNKTVELLHLPGHSPDLIAVHVKDDRILFASDAVMPVPHIADGNPAVLIESLRRIKAMNLEIIVQGHGEMILRGEISEALTSNIRYLEVIQARVSRHIAAGKGREALNEITLESCGKSRIALGGLAPRLHAENLLALYQQQKGKSKA